ncbi:TPA: DUF4430 domain-containing protein [Streptococcus suis]
MKKISIIVGLFVTLFFVGCSNERIEGNAIQITLTVVSGDKNNSQEVTVESDDSVMEILEEYHQVQEEGGLITAIDNVSQYPKTNTFWMYKINGKLAEKGAKEQKVSDGDNIEFYLETFE